MLKIIWKAVKVIFILTVIGLLGFGIYYLVKTKGWPWWAGVAIGVGLLAIVVAVLFLRKYLFRRREEQFVKRIVEQDESVIQRTPVEERRQLRDLQERWKEAVNVLKQSHLKNLGNPLYVLPWYMVVGESGAGKTTAIKSSGLMSPLTDVGPATGISVTRNCDWWFFDYAVILDIAGRYVIPDDEGQDREEWKKFLGLLSKYRRREPLNGLVLVMPTDRLLSLDRGPLVEEARTLRRAIDELMRVLGAKFPVYVLMSKADKILGLSDYGRYLPPEALDQAMGLINEDFEQDPSSLVDDAVDIVVDRLKDLRLLLLHKITQSDPGLLLFPDELLSIRQNLRTFVETVFEENPYQETPLLRGIYFGSGRQAGQAVSQLIASGGAFKDHREELPGTDKGLFLSDLFAKILPADRDLFRPIREYISWRRVTQSLGLTAWAGIMLCLCGLLTLSYMKNMETLNTFTHNFEEPPALTRVLGQDLLVMGHFRTQLLEMERMNRNWYLPRLGLNQSREAEMRLKAMYCRMFREGFLNRLDQALVEEIGRFSGATKGEIIGAFVEHLETRINLLIAELNGKSFKELEKMPQPAYSAMVVVDDKLIPEIAAEFSTLYLSYLDWNADVRALNRELDYLRTWLDHVADSQGQRMHWVVDWANNQPDLKPITIDEFWGPYRKANNDQERIPQAYTRQGKNKIDSFLAQYRASLENPNVLAEPTAEFTEWYWRQYTQAWLDFGKSFREGRLFLNNEDDMRVLAQTMADPKNPYFLLLERMADELEPAYDLPGVPVWVRVTVSFKKVRQQAAQERLIQSAGLVTKAVQKGEQVITKATQQIGQDGETMQRLESVIKAADQLKAYEKALGDIIPVTSSREKAFTMAGQLYGTAGAKDSEDTSPFREAYTAFVALRGTVRQHAQRDSVFWQLFSGPLYFLLAYTTMEASCALQTEWEGQVLAEIQDMPQAKLRTAMFDKDTGLVWKFVNGPALPFLNRDLRGYYPKTSMEQAFPFENMFLSFLNEGSSQRAQLLPDYSVTLSARPTGVNREARLEPFATVLTMNCQDNPQQLENYNYPNSQEFKWKPDQCGDVILKVLFDDFTLVKTYAGVNGLPLFLDDFQDGTHIFHPEDFPDREQDLKNIGINEIRVTYAITGSAPVTKLHKTAPFPVPLSVVRCWGSNG